MYNPLFCKCTSFNFITGVIVALHLMTVICVLVLISFILLMSTVYVFMFEKKKRDK